MGTVRTVVLRDEGGLRVWATLHGGGSVSIEGQDGEELQLQNVDKVVRA